MLLWNQKSWTSSGLPQQLVSICISQFERLREGKLTGVVELSRPSTCQYFRNYDLRKKDNEDLIYEC